MENNFGNQGGNNSVNVGQGDFKGANVHVGNIVTSEQKNYTPESTKLARHLVFEKRLVKREVLSVFSILTGLSSLVGLYFSLFPFMNPALEGHWSFLFLFALGVSGSAFLISIFLKRHHFIPFLFRRFYLELSNGGGVYLTKISATCPLCGSKMNLRNVGLPKGPRDDVLICSKNPSQHRILFDPTVLEEIRESGKNLTSAVKGRS